jgi:hypothetical protein
VCPSQKQCNEDIRYKFSVPQLSPAAAAAAATAAVAVFWSKDKLLRRSRLLGIRDSSKRYTSYRRSRTTSGCSSSGISTTSSSYRSDGFSSGVSDASRSSRVSTASTVARFRRAISSYSVRTSRNVSFSHTTDSNTTGTDSEDDGTARSWRYSSSASAATTTPSTAAGATTHGTALHCCYEDEMMASSVASGSMCGSPTAEAARHFRLQRSGFLITGPSTAADGSSSGAGSSVIIVAPSKTELRRYLEVVAVVLVIAHALYQVLFVICLHSCHCANQSALLLCACVLCSVLFALRCVSAMVHVPEGAARNAEENMAALRSGLQGGNETVESETAISTLLFIAAFASGKLTGNSSSIKQKWSSNGGATTVTNGQGNGQDKSRAREKVEQISEVLHEFRERLCSSCTGFSLKRRRSGSNSSSPSNSNSGSSKQI